MMGADYQDKRIDCTADAIVLKGYYFPWGSKTIPYSTIKAVQRVDISTFRGQWRIWGTANPKYWAPLDASRTKKTAGLILDLGGSVKPFFTPDDVDAAEAVIRERAGLGPTDDSSGQSPIV